MAIQVKFFAYAREICDCESLTLSFKADETVAELQQRLIEKFPDLNKLGKAMIAVNQEYCDTQKRLEDGDEVAVIPPVSGG